MIQTAPSPDGPKPRRLLLHIGPHKTGTTVFQVWLKTHAETLTERGLAVPGRLFSKTGNAPRLAVALVKDQSQFRDLDLLPIRTRFAEFCALHPDKDVILSAEKLSFLMKRTLPYLSAIERLNIGKTSRIDPPDEAQFNQMRNSDQLVLRKYAASLGFDEVVVLFFVRDIIDSLSSSYSQRVKAYRRRSVFCFSKSGEAAVPRLKDGCTELQDAGFKVRLALYRPAGFPVPLHRRIMDLFDVPADIHAGLENPEPVKNIAPGAYQMIAIGHVFSWLMTLKDTLTGDEIKACAAFCRSFFEENPVPNDKKLSLYSMDVQTRLRATQTGLADQIAPWMSAEDAAALRDQNRAYVPQSPLRFMDLTAPVKRDVRQLLNGLAQSMRANCPIKQVPDLAALRQIGKTSPFPHSSLDPRTLGYLEGQDIQTSWLAA